MSLKAFGITFFIALILSVLAYLLQLSQIFPMPLAYLVVSFLAVVLAFLVLDAKPQSPLAKPRKRKKPAKLLNDGKVESGSVKWFSTSKGFGFITRDNGEDIFVHFRSINGKGHRALREGQRVAFSISEGSKGLQAEDVNILRD